MNFRGILGFFSTRFCFYLKVKKIFLKGQLKKFKTQHVLIQLKIALEGINLKILIFKGLLDEPIENLCIFFFCFLYNTYFKRNKFN